MRVHTIQPILVNILAKSIGLYLFLTWTARGWPVRMRCRTVRSRPYKTLRLGDTANFLVFLTPRHHSGCPDHVCIRAVDGTTTDLLTILNGKWANRPASWKGEVSTWWDSPGHRISTSGSSQRRLCLLSADNDAEGLIHIDSQDPKQTRQFASNLWQ